MEFYEMSFRSCLNQNEATIFLGKSLGVDQTLIGDESEFWSRFGGDNPLSVGVGIRWSKRGYCTFLKWVQDSEIAGSQLLHMAILGAKHFNTDVAIGDFRAFAESQACRFLVANSDGAVFQAYEVSNGDIFELALNPAPLDTKEILEQR
jgi:hypothetical protein